MDRTHFLKKSMRFIMFSCLTMFAGFMLVKSSKAEEVCPDFRSKSSCDLCRLNKECSQNRAVQFRETSKIINTVDKNIND